MVWDLFCWLMSWVWMCVSAIICYRILKFCIVLVRCWTLFWLYPKIGWLVDLDKEFKDLRAVVTGVTSGIGKAYTIELAKKGIKKFLLLARNEEKLKAVAEYLEKEFGVECKIFAMDFARPVEQWEEAEPFLSQFQDVGILVNNAGMAPEQGPLRFLENRPGLALDIVKVNTYAAVCMVDIFLPQMVERDRGIIVNVGSIIGWKPMPWTSTYSASKAGIGFFSESLSQEYHRTGLKIQLLVPAVVVTKMSQRDSANGLFVVTPENFAAQAVSIIGACHVSTGCIPHEIQASLCQLIPYAFYQWFIIPLIIRFEKKRVDAYLLAKTKRDS